MRPHYLQECKKDVAYNYRCCTQHGLCDGHTVIRVSCAKITGPIKMPFGGLTHVGTWNQVIVWVQIPSWEGTLMRGHMLAVVTYICMRALRTVNHLSRVTRWQWYFLPDYFWHSFLNWQLLLHHSRTNESVIFQLTRNQQWQAITMSSWETSYAS